MISPASEISVRLGTTWIPQEDIQQFMVELLTPSSYAAGRLQVRSRPYLVGKERVAAVKDMGNRIDLMRS